MKVYLVRHGQSQANQAGLYQGRGESPLTLLGKQMVASVALFLEKQAPIDCFYSSSAIRACETSEIIGNRLGVKFSTFENLKEIDVGALEGVLRSESRSLFPDFFDQCDVDKSAARYPNGESYKELHDRTKRWLECVPKNAHILIVAHEVVNRSLLSHFTNLNFQEALKQRQGHQEIFVIEDQNFELLTV